MNDNIIMLLAMVLSFQFLAMLFALIRAINAKKDTVRVFTIRDKSSKIDPPDMTEENVEIEEQELTEVTPRRRPRASVQ